MPRAREPQDAIVLQENVSIPIQMPELNEFQQGVWDDHRYHWLLFAGRRCGKTMLAILRSIKVAWAGGRVAWCAANSEQGMAGWNELVEFVKANLLDYCTRKDFASRHYIQFTTGGTIKLVSAFSTTSKSTKGRGFSYHLVVVDEVQMVDHKFVKRIRPSLLTTRGALVLMGTPPETIAELEQARWIRQWMDDVYSGKRKRGNWVIRETPTNARIIAFAMRKEAEANGDFLTEEQALSAAQQFLDDEREDDPIAFNREYNVQWIIDQSLMCYPEFSDRHISQAFDHVPGEPHYCVIDRGEGGEGATVCIYAHAYLKQVAGRQHLAVRVFDELMTREVISEELFISLCLSEKDYGLPQMWAYDIRAPGVGNALHELAMPYQSRSVGIESGIARVRRLMRMGLLEIHPRCERLIHALRSYDRISGKPTDKNADFPDALRYLVAMVESENGVERTEAEAVKLELERRFAQSAYERSLMASGVHLLDIPVL